MRLGFGLSGLIVAILSFFIPVYGIFIGWLGLALVTIAALSGERGLTIATVILSVVNYMLFSPMLWVAETGAGLSGVPGFVLPTFLIVAAPIVGIILNATGKFALSQGKKSHIN